MNILGDIAKIRLSFKQLKRYDTWHVIEGPGFDSRSAINLFLLSMFASEKIFIYL